MNQIIKKLVALDGSINLIIPFGKSFIECRYVQRSSNYISAYVSSHNGCKMGCTFCWLTAQKQNEFKHVGIIEYDLQLRSILSNIPKYHVPYAEEKINNTRINVNFMGRGEALANKNVILQYPKLYDTLLQTIKDFNYEELKMNISTIMPTVIKNHKLINIFQDKPVNIYYSLYSVDDKIKKEIMPGAMDWKLALDNLSEYQQKTPLVSNSVVFHGTFIKGINDSDEAVRAFVDEIIKRPFYRTKFNLVRFNPPRQSNLQETSEERLCEIFTYISSKMKDSGMNKKSTIIQRAGIEAYVSCGMFPQDDEI
jgi:adenine C2-methylase RlmN of 23S rRNA A2503 and tRNA A37